MVYLSNHVGLMLSFIFLSFFIVFSSEIISYQNKTALALSKTNNIAIYIQENGYDEFDEKLNEQLTYFISYEITQENKTDGFITYHIITKNQYEGFSSLFNYLSKEIVCELTVYRKE